MSLVVYFFVDFYECCDCVLCVVVCVFEICCVVLCLCVDVDVFCVVCCVFILCV